MSRSPTERAGSRHISNLLMFIDIEDNIDFNCGGNFLGFIFILDFSLLLA